MILEKIKNFNWYNEPKNVRFIENGILVETYPCTDFWQCLDSNFSKDNGHLFTEEYNGDFVITAKWSFYKIKDSAQCGIMVRFNEHNWIKVGLLSPDPNDLQIGTVVSNNGSCDWSTNRINSDNLAIWFKLRRKGCDFVAFYSHDGVFFDQVRMIHFAKANNFAKVGVYACSPKNENFECVLEYLDVDVR